MNTSSTPAAPVLTACPPWCAGEHWTSDKEGDLGMHAATTRRERWEVERALFFNHDRSEYGREVRVRVRGEDGLTPEQARELARDLINAADALTPAGRIGLDALLVPLKAINDARGTSHTLESVATACDVDLEHASEADAGRMASYIGGTLMTA